MRPSFFNVKSWFWTAAFVLLNATPGMATVSIDVESVNTVPNIGAQTSQYVVGTITLTNDEAIADFRLQLSGSGEFVREGSSGGQGSETRYSISLQDSGQGGLTAPILPPGLPDTVDLGFGDYTVVFDASSGGYANGKVYNIAVSTAQNLKLLRGSYTTTITVTLITN